MEDGSEPPPKQNKIKQNKKAKNNQAKANYLIS
jgi:hypothetical protein